jgi:hypothetical protein
MIVVAVLDYLFIEPYFEKHDIRPIWSDSKETRKIRARLFEFAFLAIGIFLIIAGVIK